MVDKHDVEREIIEKAMKDPSFKKKLLSDPKEAVKEVVSSLGLEPKSVDALNIQAHQDGLRDWHIHVPAEYAFENINAGGCTI